MISKIEKLFEQQKISYKKYQHQPVFTVNKAKALVFDEAILEIKNLFLKNKNKSNFYLFCVPANRKISIAELAIITNEKKLSFASDDDLFRLLGVHSGSVSLLNIVNDEAKIVNYYIDQSIIKHPHVAFHPNRNDQTYIFNGQEIPKLISYCSITNYHLF